VNRLLLLLVGIWSVSLSGSALAQDAPPEKPRGGIQLEDPLEPLAPREKRSEAEEDRLQAAALFAAGRMLEQKGEGEAALRRYQRAYRYDGDSVSILREIIPLAFSVGRTQEAVRYALIAVEKDPTDPALMRRLALFLAEQNEWERALSLYELLLKQLEGEPESTTEVILVQMEMGRLYFLAGKLDKAAGAFAKVDTALENPAQFGLDKMTEEALRGDAALTYQLFAESYLAAGELDKAERAFRKVHDVKPNRGLLGYRLARVAAARDNSAAALDLLRDYFGEKLDTEGLEPYELLAQLLTDLNQKESINDQLEALRVSDPENELLTYFLAKRYLDAKDFVRAEPLLKELIKESDDAPLANAYQGLIELYTTIGDMPKLLETLGAAVGQTKTLEPFDEAIQPLLKSPEKLDELFALARERREGGKKPPVGEALAVAQLAIQADKFDVADTFFPWALEDEPDRKAEILLTWGLELFLSDQYESAARVFQRGVDEKLLPADNPAFSYYLAGALEMAGQTDAALAAARQAAEAQPDAAEFASRLPWVLYHAKRYDEARESYLKLLEKFDDQHESEAVRDVMRETRLILSNIDVLRDDMPAAEEWLEQVLDEYPEDAGAMNDLGYLWADQNKHLRRAERMIRYALAKQPDNHAYQDSLGWVLYRQGKYDEAITWLEKAAAGEDPDGVILEHLGDAYDKNNQSEKARDAWQRAAQALEASGEADKAQQVREKLKHEGAAAAPSGAPPPAQ